ncbi:phosphonate transport system substrate-binding protein [Clostridium acidisoli DSM 12555]|uniref:Phosphonate transport system substrate-binding protein n=1 Tax=Clostridium acidisoli DSM 12555 TaxID=1121291 RepID=A0A1W1XQY6_9CLOT|nr:phosphate/phosphite/phosphonate ABC transporter substrate-binding protein [Clostridium acidisoli]SMC26265.1 phosphonate transport system substrate-binding protein [Clostridium acidisoli DSM 12555]
MIKIKRLVTLGLAMSLSIAVLAGCGNSNSTTSGDKSSAYVPKQLTVEFVPSQNAETLEAKAKPLEKLLSARLGIPVKVSVSTDYNTIIEAMASKQVDVGFLPPTAYVLAKQKNSADLLLQAERYGINPTDGSNTDKLVTNYRSEIVVKKDSPIKTLKDLKGKKIAWQDVTSTAGYIYPAAELKKAGIDPQKDVTGVTVQGHDKGVLAVLNGDVDAAAVFEDARNVVKKDNPNVFSDTRVLYYTQPIPNDTICVRPDMDSAWKKKIQNAFIAISKDSQGKKIIYDVYSHIGYKIGNDKDFDVVRDYEKAVEGAK